MLHVGWGVTKLVSFMLTAGVVMGTGSGGRSCDEKLRVEVDAADPDASMDAAIDAPIDAKPGPQIHYLKASNTEELDDFGSTLAVSGDGNTVAIGAPGEASGAVGVETNDSFGAGGVISASGSTILIAATRENSSATGVNGDQTLNDAYHAGAGYIFE